MISIADLLKQHSKPQPEHIVQSSEPSPQEKMIKFDEENIQELAHVNDFKRKEPGYQYSSDPKTPFEEDEDGEVIDPVARENMLKN
jgi:hypothetical protein